MRDLIRILIIAALGYGLYTVFLAQQAKDEQAPELGQAGSPERCIQRLDQAGDTAQSTINAFSTTPVELSAWRTAKLGLERKISVASAACNCRGDACDRGKLAAAELRSLVIDMHDEHTQSQKPLAQAETRLDDFRRVWEEAKSLNR